MTKVVWLPIENCLPTKDGFYLAYKNSLKDVQIYYINTSINAVPIHKFGFLYFSPKRYKHPDAARIAKRQVLES